MIGLHTSSQQFGEAGFIDPGTFSFIDIKAAVAHRRACEKITAASYTVRTPGPCASDLLSLP